jgi:hypothetical protein
MVELTESQLQQIEKAVYERYPVKKHWACASQKMQMERLRQAMRKKLIEQETEKREMIKPWN